MEKYFDIRHGDVEFGDFPTVFDLALASIYFFTMLPSLPFGMAKDILYHCVMGVCDLIFIFLFYKGLQLRDCKNSRRDIEIWIFKQV